MKGVEVGRVQTSKGDLKAKPCISLSNAYLAAGAAAYLLLNGWGQFPVDPVINQLFHLLLRALILHFRATIGFGINISLTSLCRSSTHEHYMRFDCRMSS